VLWRVPDWDYSHNMAAGNILSTAEDLTRFGAAFVRPGLISAESLRLIWSSMAVAQGTVTLGFGWGVRNVDSLPRRLNTSGSNAGLQAGLLVWPDQDLAVGVLSNTWGRGARSGDMVGALPERLGVACMGGGRLPRR